MNRRLALAAVALGLTTLLLAGWAAVRAPRGRPPVAHVAAPRPPAGVAVHLVLADVLIVPADGVDPAIADVWLRDGAGAFATVGKYHGAKLVHRDDVVRAVGGEPAVGEYGGVPFSATVVSVDDAGADVRSTPATASADPTRARCGRSGARP